MRHVQYGFSNLLPTTTVVACQKHSSMKSQESLTVACRESNICQNQILLLFVKTKTTTTACQKPTNFICQNPRTAIAWQEPTLTIVATFVQSFQLSMPDITYFGG